MAQTNQAIPSFNELGLAPIILSQLKEQGFVTPTPIQSRCIPEILAGKDIVGIAQTGTGKTLAFGLPLIQQLVKNKGQALILLPTRELANQVEEVLQNMGRKLGIRTAVIIGGVHIARQFRLLTQNPHIVVATPGRLIDIIQQGRFSLKQIKTVVLDEADRMFDIGFAPQIKQILNAIPRERQTLLFSATIPNEIAGLIARYMKSPLRVEVAPSGTAASNIKQEVIMVSPECKMQLLEHQLAENSGTVLVFSRTKRGAKKYAKSICAMGHTAVEMHSNRSLSQRRAALEGFKSGKYRVLVATDIAARGIDVNDISLVVNYDLPDNLDDYVHRIGRTGRAGNSGRAVSFATMDQRGDIRSIEKLIRKTLPILPLPVLPPRRASEFNDYRSDAYGYGRGNGRKNNFFQKRHRTAY